MKTARITNAGVRTAVAAATDPDVCAAQREEDARVEREEIDRLIEEVDRELAAERQTALARVPRFIDPRRAGRGLRRVESAVLRSLPSRLSVADLIEGEAA